MKRRFQKVQTYTFDTDRHTPGLKGTEHTGKSSFATLEKAIENAEFWIYKKESWIDTTVKHIEIIDKETNEVVWQYTA